MRASAVVTASLLASCGGATESPLEPSAPPAVLATNSPAVVASAHESVATASPPLSTPAVAPANTGNPVPVDMPSPASTGPSRETLCEKALLELELAAAAPIDKCVGPRPGSNQPITINVRVDESGRIAETKWDVSTTTGYGQKAASCILAAVKALPFAEPACSKEWLLVRRAMTGRRSPSPIDSRF